MIDGIYVDYTILDECISELTLCLGENEIQRIQMLIDSLDDLFINTNSETANALLLVKEKYSEANNKITTIGENVIGILNMAKMIYQNTDNENAEQISG